MLTVTIVVEAADPFNVTEAGEMEHVDSDGAPEQLKLTAWLKPSVGLILTEYVADWPGETLAEDWVAESEKSCTVKATEAVRVTVLVPLIVSVYFPADELEPEDTVTMAVAAAVPFGVTEDGETEHVTPAGAPPQVSETDWLNPPSGVMLAVTVADWPGTNATEAGEAEAEKSVATPDRLAVCTLLVTPLLLSVTVSAPLRDPLVVGLKVTLMLQLPPAAMLAPQVLVSAKSPLATTPLMVSVAVPVLLKVSV